MRSAVPRRRARRVGQPSGCRLVGCHPRPPWRLARVEVGVGVRVGVRVRVEVRVRVAVRVRVGARARVRVGVRVRVWG